VLASCHSCSSAPSYSDGARDTRPMAEISARSRTALPSPRGAGITPLRASSSHNNQNRPYREPMADRSREAQLPRSGERSRSGRMVALVVLLLSVVGIGAVVFWVNYGELSVPSRTATAEPAAQPPVPSSPRVEASDDTMQAVNALQQSVKNLQASQQHTADQLELIQRKLASEQGERKLLSEQVGALSGRVDGLSTSATSVTTGTASQSPKKKPASSSR
jgi:uncharacterized protein HemX